MAGGRVADQVGRVLGGRYRLVAPVGTGGSAHVYVADDTTLRRRVAVKVLQPALALDQGFLRRFRAEAQAAAALNHPNIMRVFDWGEDDEGPFLVMEFLGGGTLRDMLDSGRRLSVAQAVLVGLECARALDYAHRRGLVHRDIKPANICFDEEGRAAVADFGLARALAEAAWTEPDGVLLGTARYAAPEAAQGKSVDGKADIYALALVLLEAVTGDPPPVGDTTVSTLMARANQPIVAPFGVGPLGPIVDAAGVVDPDDRPDAADLAVMLAQAARELDAPEPMPVTTVLDLDARAPSAAAADPTEMGVTSVLPIVGEAPVADEPVVHGHKTRRRVSMVIGALVAIAALVAAGLYVPTILKPFHAVPAVAGETPAQATAALTALHYKVDPKHEYSDTIARGQTTRTDPKAGIKRREGVTIHLYVSDGPAPRAVPDVVGDAFDVAKGKLLGAGFVVDDTVKHAFSETAAKDTVLSRDPAGDKLPGKTVVTLTVSDGPQPRTISDWTNKPFADAKKNIESVGLVVKRVDGYSDTVAVGNVISTSPGANQTAPKGSTVTVVVCAGPATVAVPDLTGKTIDQATQALGAVGLTVGSVTGPGKGNGRHVFTQDPAPNAKAHRGSAVDLYVTKN
ncbi:MAG TPA: PASTA domain-containing protein [Acidimicrobiales bacterium]|nr:PASTA domain-containing protein [Acidimicrobiales bacterium]